MHKSFYAEERTYLKTSINSSEEYTISTEYNVQSIYYNTIAYYATRAVNG